MTASFPGAPCGEPTGRSQGGRRRAGRRGLAGALLLAVALAGSGCSTIDSAATSVGDILTGNGGPQAGTPGYVKGFLGGVVADEPRAALVAREVLSSGGNAADAAVALGFMLTVTLPSRAGLGGGGACLAYDPDPKSVNGGVPEAILFVVPPGGGSGDRPAAVPMVPRGLFALSARYGRRPFESLTVYAEQSARFGIPASRAFIRDLEVVAGPLSGDPQARAVFFQPDGKPLAEGMTLMQPDLGATLAQLRVAGVGDLYIGGLAARFAAASQQAGGGVQPAALRASLPRTEPALVTDGLRNSQVAFLPPPADGGLAADAAFQLLRRDPAGIDAAQARAVAVAAAWRASRGAADPATLLNASLPAGTLPPLPASTSFVTLDRDGRAVVCAMTMNNLFGTGRIAPGTGIVLGASPAWMPPPLLAAALAWNPYVHAFHAAIGGSGQEAAALAVASGMVQALGPRGTGKAFMAPPSGSNAALSNIIDSAAPVVDPTAPVPRAVPEPGRTNAIACPGLLPESQTSCAWATDPRGSGLAIGGD
ncbi:Gamma-glutamyltranspeptidase [Rhodovastum atsumiense]|uniref:Gamma-glutamyltranspeptidase n=1 Tax=Rhodovastum atsumiense TaxID=504468 RepID=A0A5M6IUE5_9PROT|nr:gamma-glutamyltransferase [Rhodovastum atsumiense]KAA5611005.1 gamma-glutamyltranspeptidase [Rhodovastum atsumiense]CAH2600213.1 Gamma-glutamyltranspeptidase [Rhodovastum atsumiense]